MAQAGLHKSEQMVFTLLVQVGRRAGDGLPDGATGGGLIAYAAGRDEAEAVRETVATLKAADLVPLEVTGLGDADERQRSGYQIDAEETALMDRARAENAVIVAQFTPFFSNDEAAAWAG